MADAQGNYDAFVFITDIHWLRNTKNSPALINYISSRVPLPRVIMGGDYADGLNIDCNLAFNSLSNKIYRAIGNHEYMNYFEEDEVQVKPYHGRRNMVIITKWHDRLCYRRCKYKLLLCR